MMESGNENNRKPTMDVDVQPNAKPKRFRRKLTLSAHRYSRKRNGRYLRKKMMQRKAQIQGIAEKSKDNQQTCDPVPVNSTPPTNTTLDDTPMTEVPAYEEEVVIHTLEDTHHDVTEPEERPDSSTTPAESEILPNPIVKEANNSVEKEADKKLECAEIQQTVISAKQASENVPNLIVEKEADKKLGCAETQQTVKSAKQASGNVPNLIVEKQKPSSSNADDEIEDDGTRQTVSIKFIFQQLRKKFGKAYHGMYGCTADNMQFTGLKKLHSRTIILLKCDMCNYRTAIWSEPYKK